MGFWHCALYLAVIGLASSAAALLPRRWFHADRFPFRPQRWEHEGKIYEKLAVQRWKDKLPDMSRFLPWLTQKQVSVSISAAEISRISCAVCWPRIAVLSRIRNSLPVMPSSSGCARPGPSKLCRVW